MAYHLYLWFRGTKALKALVGLLGLGIIFTVARTWGLFLTTWVFQILWQVLVILLIILFQSEIRQVLERVNPLQVIGLHKASRPEKWIPGFTQAIVALAKRKIGALVIVERTDRVQEFIAEGQPLEGEPGPELLMSIFQKESPLHDGAMLIQGGRVTQVACYLPLTPDEGLPKEWGTRHRAAVGLSERCDAWVVVVSEERGEVSLAREKEMVHVGDAEKLSQLILEAMTPISPERKSWWERVRFFLVHRWQVKAGTLFLVATLWLMLAGQQNF
ncbi:MAG: diadenylate cyclase, partial [Deltaproteobacteria bacterium]